MTAIKAMLPAYLDLLKRHERAIEALNKITEACQCETDDRDICFDIATKALSPQPPLADAGLNKARLNSETSVCPCCGVKPDRDNDCECN